MNKPRTVVLKPGDTAIVFSGNRKAFRRLAAELLENPPAPRKGYSAVRELRKLRDRGRF